MHNIDHTVSYTIYRFDFAADGWFLYRTFDNYDDLIDYFAAQYHYANRWIEVPYVGYVEEECLDDSIHDWFCHNANEVAAYRTLMLVDSESRIVDPRWYAGEIEKRFHVMDAKSLGKRYHRSRMQVASTPYRSRELIKRNSYEKTGFRSEKNWFHNYRQDHIPEYRGFVRAEGRVPNIWDSEPKIEEKKSWKDTTKCRRQYLVGKKKHMDTVK